MHAHLFFIGPKPASRHPLGKMMADGNATLVSWSLVGDMRWIRPSPTGLRQKGAPKRGDATNWFKEEVARVTQHARAQKIKIVTTPADIDRALEGEPHVVLSVEGASFLDDGIESLEDRVRGGHPPYPARPLRPQYDRRFPDRAAPAQWADRVRPAGREGVQPSRHSRRSRALHERGGGAGAGGVERAGRVVAQLGDERQFFQAQR